MTLIGKTLMATVATATLALGVTAPASAQAWYGNGYDRGYDRGWHEYDRFDRDRMVGNPRFAIEQCSRAATRQARGMARVTGIDDVDRTRDGYRIRGELVVNRPSDRWGDRWGHDDWHRNSDRGSFTCKVAYGRIVDLDFHGLRD